MSVMGGKRTLISGLALALITVNGAPHGLLTRLKLSKVEGEVLVDFLDFIVAKHLKRLVNFEDAKAMMFNISDK